MPGLPGRDHLQDPLPRGAGAGRAGPHSLGVPQVLPRRCRAVAVRAQRAARPLPAVAGDPGSSRRAGPGPRSVAAAGTSAPPAAAGARCLGRRGGHRSGRGARGPAEPGGPAGDDRRRPRVTGVPGVLRAGGATGGDRAVRRRGRDGDPRGHRARGIRDRAPSSACLPCGSRTGGGARRAGGGPDAPATGAGGVGPGRRGGRGGGGVLPAVTRGPCAHGARPGRALGTARRSTGASARNGTALDRGER